MKNHLTKIIALLSVALVATGLFGISTGSSEPESALAVNVDITGSGSGTSSSTSGTTSSGTSSSTSGYGSTTTELPDTSTTTDEPAETVTENPDTADEDLVFVLVAIGVAGLAFSCRQYFLRH